MDGVDELIFLTFFKTISLNSDRINWFFPEIRTIEVFSMER